MQYLFTIKGIVQKGKDRGKRFGFPTANIPLNYEIPQGVYISQTELENRVFSSVTFIGKAETFNENVLQAETLILNFNQEIYGQEITINLIKKIRESKKFNSEQELIVQIKKDKIQGESFFLTNKS